MAGELFYVGTYSARGSEGIYTCSFHPESGELALTNVTRGARNASFLACHPSKRWLYAVEELAEYQGVTGGGVKAYEIAGDGELIPLNSQPTHGGSPCHLVVEGTGSCLLVANYRAGNVSVLPLAADGTLLPASQTIQHQGASVHPQRQQGPHAHSVTITPDNRFALVADLGLDQVLRYRLHINGAIVPAVPPYLSLPAGSGPRHLAFHGNGHWLYVINELDSTLSFCTYDGDSGELALLQTLSTLPADFAGENSCADVHVHPNGRLLFGSNRGHDSIAVFRIADDGFLTALGQYPCGGRTPRNFAVAPGGDFLLTANQDSDNVCVLRLDRDTGDLTPTGAEVEVSMPVCLRFTRA